MKEIDLHSALFVLEWIKEHKEICIWNFIEDATYYDMNEEKQVTNGELLDRIKNDYEQRNKQ